MIDLLDMAKKPMLSPSEIRYIERLISALLKLSESDLEVARVDISAENALPLALVMAGGLGALE